MSTNEYGLDSDYFRRKLERMLRDVNSYTPDEMARELARMARTADEAVLSEPEFAKVAVPDERNPVGGLDHGWIGEYNRGWNACRSAMLAAGQQEAVYVPREILRRTYNDLDSCQKVIWLRGGVDPAYVSDAQARLKELEPLLFGGAS